jgi:hypothetical protein
MDLNIIVDFQVWQFLKKIFNYLKIKESNYFA